jgi:hypothetical protein
MVIANADASRLLMSDTLKGNLQEFDQDEVDSVVDLYMICVINRTVSGNPKPVTGILRSILFDDKPEVELSVSVDDAFSFVEAEEQLFASVEIHHGERIVMMNGPFIIKAARLQDMDVKNQTCVVLMQLNRTK